MATSTETAVENEIHVTPPSLFKVLLHNDDKTTFDFVIAVLQQVFHKSQEQAHEITFVIHTTGRAVAGVYTREIAEEKALEAISLARLHKFPLLATCEEE
jgi:ATP-dependent Clp protease adaptor protein ClpS